jgi:hypothetical protein
MGGRSRSDSSTEGDGQPAESPVSADELGHEGIGRRAQHPRRGVVLGQPAALGEHRHPVTETYRLLDVVGHEHHGLAQIFLQPPELLLEPQAYDRVDSTERLVHQQYGWVGSEGSGHPYPLALPAGQLRRGSGRRR